MWMMEGGEEEEEEVVDETGRSRRLKSTGTGVCQGDGCGPCANSRQQPLGLPGVTLAPPQQCSAFLPKDRANETPGHIPAPLGTPASYATFEDSRSPEVVHNEIDEALVASRISVTARISKRPFGPVCSYCTLHHIDFSNDMKDTWACPRELSQTAAPTVSFV